jgi:uncharacterized protein YraI
MGSMKTCFRRLGGPVILLIAALIGVVPVMAQQTIQVNQTALGAITAQTPQVAYLFTGGAGQTVQVEVISVSEGLGLQFVVTDAAGALVRAVGNPNLESTIQDSFTFPAAGAFTITVASVNNTQGDFVVRITGEGAAVPPAVTTTCPALVDEVVTAADAACAVAGRNQACYGNVLVEGQTRPGSPVQTFNQRGDIVDLLNLQTLKAHPMNVSNGTWGVAVLRVQANLPDTIPGQNVTMLVFGDVEIQNAGGATATTFPVTITTNTNVRTGPATNYAVLRILVAGASVMADGRLADGSWLRVRLDDGQLAWVFAPAVISNGDLASLEVLSPETNAPTYGPMQAFYFSAGVGDAACNEAPDSGILIQTPEGVGEIVLRVNEIDVLLSSTVYLRARANESLTVSTLEGTAEIEAFGIRQVASQGTQIRVPLDADLRAAGPPQEPEPVIPEELISLPIEILPEPVTIPQPGEIPEATPEGVEEGIVLPTLPTGGPCVVATATEGGVNVRTGPSTDFAIQSRLDPTQVYSVVGRNSERSWHQIVGGGWVALSVTRLGGDCSGVPVTFTPPTAAPTLPAPTLPAPVTAPPVAGDNETFVTVDYNQGPVTVSGAISYPNGDTQDTISYQWANVPQFFNQGAQFRYSITCTGSGTENALIVFSDGSTRDCVPTPANFVQILSNSTPSSQQKSADSFTIMLTGGTDAFVNWSVTFSFFRG